MNLQEIVARLNLKPKITKNKEQYIVYMVIEDSNNIPYPLTRPMFDSEIKEVMTRENDLEVIEAYLREEKKKQQMIRQYINHGR